MKIEAEIRNEFHSSMKDTPLNKLATTPGIWLDGKIYWIQNGYEKLIPEHAISVHVKNIHKHSKIQYNEIFVRNHSSEWKEMKILLLNHFTNPFKEHVAFVAPTENVIYHSVDDELFLVNGVNKGNSMEQRTVQPIWNVHTDHIWNNFSKGQLKYQPMAKGSCVSIFSLNMEIEPQSTDQCQAWSIHGQSKKELLDFNTVLLKTSTSIS
ncbi:hypothetical protein [Bacillus sp. B1-b2]|uniref:hypothetical protein n=1 Tax=Bacillus sp. B1-b2 TaxID=2653201 RepID=UPI001261C998|nr:hypothetical protein [Bacillus sp. B1-b2]KAB7670035.1 hypothetical protein F9279_09885 [Bacillus sp. B1-b2]